MLKTLFVSATLMLSTLTFAHPNGTYVIDNNSEATVTFLVIARCPVVEGALTGNLRTLTFSETALAEPYNFVSGSFVEIHDANGEVYVEVNDQCVPVEGGQHIVADRDSFAGFALRRAN